MMKRNDKLTCKISQTLKFPDLWWFLHSMRTLRQQTEQRVPSPFSSKTHSVNSARIWSATCVHVYFHTRLSAVSSGQSLLYTEFSQSQWMFWSFRWCTQCMHDTEDAPSTLLRDLYTSAIYLSPLCDWWILVCVKTCGKLRKDLLEPWSGLEQRLLQPRCIRLFEGYQTPLTTVDHAYRKYKSHMSSIISRKVGRPKTDTDLFSMQCKVFFWGSICIRNIKINILYYCIFKNPHHWYFNNFVTICRGYSPTRWGWGMAVAENSQNKVESCSFWQINCINCEY